MKAITLTFRRVDEEKPPWTRCIVYRGAVIECLTYSPGVGGGLGYWHNPDWHHGQHAQRVEVEPSDLWAVVDLFELENRQ